MLLAIGAVLVVLLAVAALRVYGVYRDMEDARARLNGALSVAQSAGFGMSSSDVGRIASELGAADDALGRAEGELRHDPLFAFLRQLPVSGQQLSALDTMIEAARKVTSRHDQAVEVLTAFVAARDSAAGATRLAAFARFAAGRQAEIDELLVSFQEADRLVSGVPSAGLLGPVASARNLLVARFEQARPAVAAARQAVAIVPSLFGVGGQKRYLVYAMDNAEVRPMGGLIAAFATPRFRDGALEDPTFRDILSVDLPGQKVYVQPPQGLGDHLLGVHTWQVADAGWWPDFARSAAEARRMYKLETGDGDFQGTIAFTPELVDGLLKVVGPVTVPEAGVTVHPGETYLLSLEQVEVKNRGKGRKAFLANLASQVVARLFALPPSRYPDLVAALADAGAHRQLQMVFDDRPVQAVVDTLGWSGSFTFPSAGDRLSIMEANVGPPSKLDVLLSLDHSLDVQIQADGSASEHLVTTYTNRYGPVLPPELERVRSTFKDGILGSYSRRYLAPDADVTSVSSDDPKFPITDPNSLELESGCLAVGSYQLVGPGTVHLTTDYTVPNIVQQAQPGSGKGKVYRLYFRKQPGRDHDSLTVQVTVPDGMRAISWSQGGVQAGRSVTFAVTTEFDHAFEVEFGP